MQAHKIKYTIEFDIPIKIEGSQLNPKNFVSIEAMFEQACKVNLFYFKKEGEDAYHMRAKNVKITKEQTIGDYVI